MPAGVRETHTVAHLQNGEESTWWNAEGTARGQQQCHVAKEEELWNAEGTAPNQNPLWNAEGTAPNQNLR